MPARKPPPGLFIPDCVRFLDEAGGSFVLMVFQFLMVKEIAVAVASVDALLIRHNTRDRAVLPRHVVGISDRDMLPLPSKTASSILIHSFDEAKEATDQEQSTPTER